LLAGVFLGLLALLETLFHLLLCSLLLALLPDPADDDERFSFQKSVFKEVQLLIGDHLGDVKIVEFS